MSVELLARIHFAFTIGVIYRILGGKVRLDSMSY